MVLLSTALQNLGNYPAPGAAVAATAPSNPTTGRTWFDTGTEELKVYDGSGWKPAVIAGTAALPFVFSGAVFNVGTNPTLTTGIAFDGADATSSSTLTYPQTDLNGHRTTLFADNGPSANRMIYIRDQDGQHCSFLGNLGFSVADNSQMSLIDWAIPSGFIWSQPLSLIIV